MLCFVRVGGLLSESTKIEKTSYKDAPCVFDGFNEGIYYMTISNETNRRYFAYQAGNFTEPFGKAWFSDIINLSYTSGQGITVTQSNYEAIIVIICRVG